MMVNGDDRIARVAFTIPEAAKSMGIGENTLRTLIKNRPDFPVMKVSEGRKIIPVQALCEWLAREVPREVP